MVDLYIYVVDAVTGLRRASTKKEMQTKTPSVLVLYSYKTNVTSYEIFGQYSYVRVPLIGQQYEKKQIQ